MRLCKKTIKENRQNGENKEHGEYKRQEFPLDTAPGDLTAANGPAMGEGQGKESKTPPKQEVRTGKGEGKLEVEGENQVR